MATSTALAGGGVSLAPHLRDVSKRFKHYADGSSDLTGEPLMSAESFLRACLGADKDEPVSAKTVQYLKERLNDVESKNGGKLNYAAYSVMTMILSVSNEELERYFILYDQDESGTLSGTEFQQMLDCIGVYKDKTARPSLNCGIADKLTGHSLGGQVNMEQYMALATQLRADVWLAGFSHFDKADKGALDAATFIHLVLSSVGIYGSQAQMRSDRILKLHREGKETTLTISDSYDASAWIAFNQVTRNLKNMERIMSLAKKKFPLTPGGWHCMCRAANINIPREHSDLFYAIFDRSGDRVLDHVEVTQALALYSRMS